MKCQRHLRWASLLLLFTLSAGVPLLLAQTETSGVQPYASMDRANVDYRGAGREKNSDLHGHEVRIGILVPLQGKRAAEGKMLLQAAQVAIDAENEGNALPDGQRFGLAVEDESGPWGQASNAMIRLVLQDEAVALITSTDGNIAHQAEQIANKVGIAVVTLSSDPTTTRINVPWIFRAAPSDEEQAQAIAEKLFATRSFRNVLLITETGHDGRIGGQEFLRAAVSLHAEAPSQLEINPEDRWQDALLQAIDAAKPEVVVLWTSPTLANQLLLVIGERAPSTRIYLCQKAAGYFPRGSSETTAQNDQVFTVGPQSGDREFTRRYREKTGEVPGIAAQQISAAIRSLAEAVRKAGTNRARVRDCLAQRTAAESTAGVISFDSAGNLKGKSNLVRVETKPEKEMAAVPK